MCHPWSKNGHKALFGGAHAPLKAVKQPIEGKRLMGWIEMNEKTKKAQKATTVTSLADRYSFGHKALSVVLSVVLLGFGWPAVNPAEVFANSDAAAQSEVAQTQESATGATDAPAVQQAESASSEQAVETSGVDEAADANAAASSSTAPASEQPATQPSANKAASADASAQAKSEYDIALELNNASIKKADGTDAVISLPATKVTVPAGADFKFTVVPDNGCKLNRVLVAVGGQQSPLAADDAGVYTIKASAFEAGVTITLETEKDEATAQPTAPAQPITDSAVESGSAGEANGNDAASTDETSNADSNGTANKEESNADDEQAPEQSNTGSLLDSISGFFPALGGNASVTSNVSGSAGQTINAKVGDTVTLNGTSNTGYYWLWSWYDCGYSHSWKVAGDNKNDVTMSGSGESVSASFAKAGTYTIEHKYCKKEHSSGSHNTDKETFTVIVSDNSVASLTISGASSVNQFETTQLTTNASDVTWTSSDSSIATIDASGKVTGVAEGKVTITATAITTEGKVLTVTHDVTVTKSTAQKKDAKLFFLKSPTNNPDSNSAGDWFPTGGSSDLNVKVNVYGAAFSGVNTWDNVANRVVSWPDGSTGATWTLPRANSYWSQVFNNYKKEIQDKLGVSITENDVEAIILHPYKISNNSSGYHLDCKVEIKVKQVVTATFWIQSPGATGFDKQYSVSTLEVKDGVAQVVAPEAPEAEKTVNGTKYKFMGWYSDQACTQPVTFPVTTSENVFYYGKYVPCDQSIQVNYYLEGTTTPVAPSKTLTGYMKGQTVTQEPIAIVGYTPVSNEAKMGVVGTDASIDFYYTANTVNYKVEYYWNGSDKPFATDNASGKYGETINNIEPKSFSGYTAVSNDAQSLKLSVDENQNVVKFYYYKNVTLTANSDTKTYNGSEQSVDGYTTNLPEGTSTSFDGVTLNGGKGTNVGDYAYKFADGTVGKVSTDSNYIVTEVKPGNLHISPVTNEVTIAITGHKGGEKYNGEEQTVSGYDVSGLPAGVTDKDVTYAGSAEVKATDAGTYQMNLNEDLFSLTGDAAKNYTKINFKVTDGELNIGKRQVTLESEKGHKNYDGKTLQRRTNLNVSGDGFVGNDGVLAKEKLTWYDENNILPGTYENKFDPAYTEGTNLNNYEVTLKFGELVVNARSDKDKYQITVTANSDTQTYSGIVYSVSGLSDTTFTNDKGATFTVEGLGATVSGTDAGEYANEVTGTAVVKDAQGNDVTSQFNVTTVDGKLTINKRNVTIKPKDASKVYDGNALVATDWEVAEGSFVNGQGIANPTYTGSQTAPGTSESGISEWGYQDDTNANNYNIKTQPGTLNVTSRGATQTITVEANSTDATYDGTEYSAKGFKANEFEVDGKKYTVSGLTTQDPKATDAGTYTNNIIGTAKVTDAQGNDVTSEFKVETVNGALTIAMANVTIAPKDASKPYDGQPLTATDFTATGFVGNDTVTNVVYGGSQTEAGESKSSITSYEAAEGTNLNNYNITKGSGTLKVTVSEQIVVVKIKGNESTQKYNGSEQSVSGYKVTGVTVDGKESTFYGAVAGTDFTFSGAATAARTDAGTTYMGLTAGQFTNVNGNFSNVTFEVVEDGTMTVTPREVTLTSATDEKPYDGTALTNGNVTVSGDGFAQGQGFTADVTGSQTNAGSSENTFTYGLTEGTNTGNYQITTFNGTLTVKPISDPITVTIIGNTATGTYNGKGLTAESYTFDSTNVLFTEDKVSFSGTAKAARTDAGKTEMGLTTDKFSNADTTNFTNVRFVVTDGYVDISKADVTLKSADLTKQYDGAALVNGETPLEISGFAEGEGATYAFTGSQTVVGSSANAFRYKLNDNTKADNYNIATTEGTLTVTNRDAKYGITVKANSATATYDGKQHSATGVVTNEFEVNGSKYTVSGLTTQNPTQTNAGTYSNNITGTPKVTDTQGNDVTSEFEVTTENGSLIIDKATVSMKSASDKWIYDGNEHTKHEMEYVTDFAEGEGATFTYTGAITNAGEAKNTYTYTLNANTSAENYTFAEPEYGTLKVSPVTDKVTVTIKGHQETKPYNGSEQSVTGYGFSVDNGLYAESNVKFTGEATAKGTAVGTYNMNLAKEQFSNTSNNFSNVEFVVEDGWLKIEGGQIDQNGVVWTLNNLQKKYDGNTYAAGPATAKDKFGNSLTVEYSADGEKWTTDPNSITAKNYSDSKFVQLRATGSNYAKGEYAYSDEPEQLFIGKRLLTMTSAGDGKVYDGTPLKKNAQSDIAVTRDGFVDGEGATYDITGSQTEVGSSKNTFTYELNKGTLAENYQIELVPGTLTVTANEDEVVVSIQGKHDTKEYNGQPQSVEGYEVVSISNDKYTASDFELTTEGEAKAERTDEGTTYMGLAPSDFVNKSDNFTKVTFQVTDGYITITSKSVETGESMTVEAPKDVKYNGQSQQEKPVVKDGEKALVEGTDYTLSYSKDTTNVGTVTVTVTGKGNYTGSVDVTYQILKRSVVLASSTDSKPYDGTALTKPDVTVTGDGFVDGEVVNVRATGSVTTVAEGEVTNTIAYDKGANFKADNYDITKNEGKLSITALSAEDGLAITPHNVEYTYNAESHSAGSASASASVAGVNVSLEYRVKGSPDTEWRSDASVITAINAGTVPIEVRAFADNYSGYKYAEQTLTINKRDVELTSASASKVYDGTALTKDWVDMGPNRVDTGFIWTDLVGDGRVHANGSQTEVGTSNNTISYQLKDGAANNYNILPENLGTLTVTAQSIVPDPENPESYTGVTISNPSDSVYNGEEHKWTPEVKDAKGNALVEGTDYTVSYDTDNFIDAKTIKVTITGIDNYIGTATKTYKITPAPLTVNANSDSKVYDGNPLIAGGTIDGLVGEEKASAKTEGSQTEVGSSENKVVGIEWGTAKESNYYIQSQNDGTLTVTGKSIAASDMKVGDLHDVVYSGTEQVQKPEVKDGEKTLVEGTDYDLTFSEDEINVGTVTVVVIGKGNYTGEVTRTYQITPATLTVATLSDSKTYDGDALTAEGTITGFVNGETADFATTGTQTKVGSSTNTYVIDWTAAGNTAKQGNYTISENLGTLTVTEATDEISAAPGSYNGTYDGQAHGVDVTVTGLPKGYSVKSAVSYATATDVTDGVTANVDELVIVNEQGEDVTANLKITKGTGTIKITPATLKVTTHGAKAEYNGSALTAGGKVTGFVNNEAATLTTTGSQTLVGKSTNTYAIDWNDTAKKENYTIEEELGTLEVTQNMTSIMVIPQGGSKPYDGTALTSAGVATYGLPAGYTLTATTKGSVTNVGSATAEVDTYSIKDAAGEDVTSQFGNVFTGKATLQVTKRLVTVVSASASKVYDGTALTKPEASVTEGSFAKGESFSYDFSGEQTTVGSTSNAYTIKAVANTDLNNYEITKVDGTLTVTAQSINPADPTPGAYVGVEVDSPSDVTYDANEHKWAPEVKDAKGNALVEGTDYDVTYSTDDFTNVTGAITVTITGKGNYTGTVTRIYQITPASVILSSNSHEFVYTGEPQGDATVNVTGAAELFQSQVNDLKATGSVTNVGDVAENSISYNWNDGFTADNYSIETSFGKLSVVAKNIDTGKDMSVNDPVNVTYNGGDQTWAPTVNDGEKTLVEGSDYTVGYSTKDRTNVTGAITVTIVGKGNYTGELTRTYQVLPKAYTVVTGSASKVYDGEPLLGTDSKVAPANMVEGLVNASDATFSVTGSQTEVGGTPNNNTYELTFASEQMAKNYTLAGEQLGTLTVTEYADEIVVTTTGGTFTYDGQAHGATVSVSELPEGYTLEKAESSASATNVADGTVVATADTLVIRNAQGKDVTGELKIRKIDGEIEITPAPLSIETGSATKTYDGSALTNATLKVDGLVAGDVVTGRTTGSQTEVGSSANTYTLTWGEVDAANYEITEQLGVLTVEAAVVPVVPGPQQPSGPVVVPPATPEPAGPADVVANALEGAYETVTGDKAAEEQIYDSENPLGKEQAAHCWVHWYMILAMILTALYGVAVWLRRGNHTRKLKNDMNNILGGGDDGKDPSGSPVATNHPAGMEA